MNSDSIVHNQEITCVTLEVKRDVYFARSFAGVEPHSTFVAVSMTIRGADRCNTATTGITAATYRSPQLVQVTGERRRTPESVARI